MTLQLSKPQQESLRVLQTAYPDLPVVLIDGDARETIRADVSVHRARNLNQRLHRAAPAYRIAESHPAVCGFL